MHFSPRLKVTSIVALLFLVIISVLNPVSAQTNLELYGKNRVQTREYKWRFYDTKHFRIYHYDRAGRELARYVAEQVENDINVIENKIGGKFPDQFHIILYNSYDEYKQTNIGRESNSQLRDMPAGTVNVVGNKLVVYFTGEHTDLRRQTRAGMAKVVMERMLFGENIGEVVRNALLLNLPDWAVNGFISYVVDGWDDKANSKWKNLIEADTTADFYKLSELDPELAGKAFWKYVSDRYGESSMKELVYTTQLKGSLNQAVKLTLGMKVAAAYDSVMVFYDDVYARDEALHEVPDSTHALIEINIPKETIIKDIRVAPRGLDVAYVAWKNGEYDVMLKKTQKQQVAASILHGGKIDYNAQPDPNYPLLTWSNTGYKLAILYKNGNETRLRIYNSIKARIENYVIPENRFDRVLSMTFMEDDDKMIFSAIKNSQTDLYEFTIRGKRMKNITDDEWDDMQPWYVSGGSRRGILFISNRPEANTDVPLQVNQLPTGPMNVYFYNTTTKSKRLLKLTNHTKGHVTQPIQYGSEDYAYLFNENGIFNQYLIRLKNDSKNMDSSYSSVITDYATNIINHQYNPVSNQIADVLRVGNKYKVYYKPLIKSTEKVTPKELEPTLLKQSEETKKRSVLTSGTTSRSSDEPVLKRGNTFQSDFDNEGYQADSKKKDSGEGAVAEGEVKKSLQFEDENKVTESDSTYMNMRSYPYRLSFKPKDVTVRVDNSMLFTRYQPAGMNANTFQNPELGGMITASLEDLMEDHVFTGGFRIPLNFSGLTYFIKYENYKRRVDWDVMYFRQENVRTQYVEHVEVRNNTAFITPREQLAKTATDILQVGASYPLNKFESIRMQMAFRRDAMNFKAQDSLSLAIPYPDDRQYWLMSRAEYVFDNTSNPAINIYRGFRYKFFAEYMFKLDNPTGSLYNLGTDFRYYKRIYKNVIWAARVNIAHSGGNNKVLYFLGGVDNWISPKYADGTPIRQGEQYAFQALATNMRGYERNSYNGNTYGVFNTEFRIPFIASFVNKPIQSPILKNLQLVAFADVGSAWFGVWPTEANVQADEIFPEPLNFYLYPNTQLVSNEPVTVSVEDTKNVFGLGYGAGLRTMLFGYFLRLDCAWNIENHLRTPLLHFSIGTDF